MLNLLKTILKLTCITALVINSAGQGYALRPMATIVSDNTLELDAVSSGTENAKASPARNSPTPLLHFPKWLQERLKPKLIQALGKEAARFVLRDCGFAFIGRISGIPRRLRKKLKPVKYLNKIVICKGAIPYVAKVLQENIPRYQDVALRLVERELFQTLLYHSRRKLKIETRGLDFNKLKEQILKILQETKTNCPKFKAFLEALRRQYRYTSREDAEILGEFTVHFITEAVLFGNLPRIIFDQSGRSDREEEIDPAIALAIIKFITESKLVNYEEMKILSKFTTPSGAAREKKKAMGLSIFDFMEQKDLIEDIKRALRRDIGSGDVTTELLYGEDERDAVVISAQEKGILAGLEVIKLVLKTYDPDLEIKALVREGDELYKGKEILVISGRKRSIHTAKRVALNYLMRLSGIATITAKFVERTLGTDVEILDTRKTTPGWGALEKYAVRIGGGKNHRMSLDEMVMIKKDDIRACGGITEAVSRIRRKNKEIFVEVEAETLAQVDKIMDCEARGLTVDRIMLDNMSRRKMRKAVKRIHNSEYYQTYGRPTIEASGKVTLRKVGPIARTGVDYISVGAITHSAPSLDMHLEAEEAVEPNTKAPSDGGEAPAIAETITNAHALHYAINVAA